MTISSLTDTLLDAALPHVAFDGWSPATFKAAAEDAGVDIAAARAACPKGAVDLAVAYHRRGDDEMIAALKAADLSQMRFRDKVAHAVKLRLRAIDDKEAVRRATTLFALPHMAGEGAALIWGTSDAIWTALGDSSTDGNWYSKRAILSGVYSASVLFWLGDDSLDMQATDAFVDRRIDNVMQIESAKAMARKNPILRPFAKAADQLMGAIKAPTTMGDPDLPGIWRG